MKREEYEKLKYGDILVLDKRFNSKKMRKRLYRVIDFTWPGKESGQVTVEAIDPFLGIGIYNDRREFPDRLFTWLDYRKITKITEL